MEFIVSLSGVGQNGVTKSESRTLELDPNARVCLWVIASIVAMLEQTDAMLVHHLVANDDGQKLVVRDVLHHGANDAASLLEQLLVIPVRIDNGQLVRDGVVLPHPQRVHHRQLQLFVRSNIAGIEAVQVAATTAALTATIGIASLHGQQVFVSW